MPIKAETAVTEKVYKDMWRYIFFRKRSGVGIIAVTFLFSFVMLVFSFYMVSNGIESSMFGYCLFLGLILPAILLFSIFVLPGLLYKKGVAKMAKKTQHYSFEEKFFTVHSEQQEGEEGFSKINYSSLYQIHETKDYFYIYISLQQTYVVSKEDIENASPEQLRNLLQNNMPKNKYKRFGV